MNLKLNLFKKKKVVIEKDGFNDEKIIELAKNLPTIIHLFSTMNKI